MPIRRQKSVRQWDVTEEVFFDNELDDKFCKLKKIVGNKGFSGAINFSVLFVKKI